jgi:AmmeMemoRadiSam system protein A
MYRAVHPLARLAYRAVDEYVRTGRKLPVPAEEELVPEMQRRAGVFVSLHKMGGDLRGCIGTFQPQRENVAAEVIENAVASASRDPRFYPVQEWELVELEVSVDVLSEPEPVESTALLDPELFGVIVMDDSGARRGLLLPMLEQIQSAEQQVAIARQKAFIGPDERVRLFRFRVERYH